MNLPPKGGDIKEERDNKNVSKNRNRKKYPQNIGQIHTDVPLHIKEGVHHILVALFDDWHPPLHGSVSDVKGRRGSEGEGRGERGGRRRE